MGIKGEDEGEKKEGGQKTNREEPCMQK